MGAVDLCIFLAGFLFVVAVSSMAELLRTRRPWTALIVAVSLASLATTIVVGYYVEPGTTFPELVWSLVRQRDFSAVVSLTFGLATGLVWVGRLVERFGQEEEQQSESSGRQFLGQLVMGLAVGLISLAALSFVWKDINAVKLDPIVRMHADEFVIERIAKLDHAPIRVAVDDNDAFVCYDYFDAAGSMGGGIVQLARDEIDGRIVRKLVAESPLLMRCYGLAVRNGDLFVSRSGINGRADRGKIEYEATGAITRLADLDKDGYFEFVDDVVRGLPGSRGPVTMHQNNGIAFAADGSLFITTASAADRALAQHPWEGVILKASPDFSQTGIFATGFRNPFGIVIGPDEELFVTDNDVDQNPGDELNHIVRDGHYGHPYILPGESSETIGFRDPVLVSEHESTFLGMAYPTSTALPESYRNCIYIADYMRDAIWRVRLERSSDDYAVVEFEKFATVSSPIDIAVNSRGEFFVISRNTRNVYRIRAKVDRGNDDG